MEEAGPGLLTLGGSFLFQQQKSQWSNLGKLWVRPTT